MKEANNVKFDFQACRDKCNINSFCKSFLYNAKDEECTLMSLTLDEQSQNFLKLGALKHCPIAFDSCVSITIVVTLTVCFFGDTNFNFN